MSGGIIGILGGMGPEATIDLFREITRLTPARTDQDHLQVIIYSNPRIPDRTRAIFGEGEDPLPALVETARALERAGASLLAIPCNTAHHYLAGLRKQVSIPVIDMIDATCTHIRTEFPGARRPGLLATTGTIRSGLYHRACAPLGLEIVLPAQPDQTRIQAAVTAVKAGRLDRETAAVFEDAARSLAAQGADLVVMGCTEIPLVMDPASVRCPVVNPTAVLARTAIGQALARRT
jgi:aspartate racemase